MPFSSWAAAEAGGGGGTSTASHTLKIDDAQALFMGSIYKITKEKAERIENPFLLLLTWEKYPSYPRNIPGGYFHNKLTGIHDTPQGIFFVFGYDENDSAACFLVDKTTGNIETLDNPAPPNIFSRKCPIEQSGFNEDIIVRGQAGSYFISRQDAEPSPKPGETTAIQNIRKLTRNADGTFSFPIHIEPGKYKIGKKEYFEAIEYFVLDEHENIAYASEQRFEDRPDRPIYRMYTHQGKTHELPDKFWVGFDGHLYALDATKKEIIKYDKDGNVESRQGSIDAKVIQVIKGDVGSDGYVYHDFNTTVKVLNKLLLFFVYDRNDNFVGYNPPFPQKSESLIVVADEQGTNFKAVSLISHSSPPRALRQIWFSPKILKASQNWVYILQKKYTFGGKQSEEFIIEKRNPNDADLSVVNTPYNLTAAGYSDIHSFDVTKADVIYFSAKRNGREVIGKIENDVIRELGENQAGKPVEIISIR